MNKVTRILLVEDIESARETYKARLISAGFAVTAVGSAKEAIEVANKMTFHVALVDIMLDGQKNTANRDGINVISHIASLQEGTQCIPLTGQDKKSFVRDAFVEHSVFDFLDKREDITDKGWDYAIGIINRAVSECEIDDTPNWTDLIGDVIMIDEEPTFVSLVLSKIPGSKTQVLQKMLSDGVRNFQPLKGLLNAESSFSWNQASEIIVGDFWSKTLGLPIYIYINSPNDKLEEITVENILWSRQKGRLRVSILTHNDRSRADYV